MRRLGLGVLGTARGRYPKAASVPRRFLSPAAAAGVSVEWQSGTRRFTHEGSTWVEVPYSDADAPHVLAYYYDSADEARVVYQDGLPFDVVQADPNIELTPSGFKFKPTGTEWTRASAGDEFSFYYYRGEESLYMLSSMDPEKQIRGEATEEATEAAAAAAAEVEVEVAVEAEEEKKAPTADTSIPPTPAVDVAEEAPKAVDEPAAAAAPEAVPEEEEEAAPAAAAVEEVAVALEAEEEVAAAAPAAATPIVDEEQVAAAAAAAAVAAATEKQDAAAAAAAAAADAAPAEEEKALMTAEDLAKADADEQYAWHMDRARQRAEALRAAAPAADDDTAALVPREPQKTVAKSAVDFTGDLELVLPAANPLLVQEKDKESRVKIRVARSGEEEYAQHLEGLRGAMYKVAADEVQLQAKAADNEEVERYLKIKGTELMNQAKASKELALSLVANETTKTSQRYVSLPYDPMQGVGTLFLPSDARHHLLRYLVNVVSLSKALGDSQTMLELLQSEQNLGAVVLETHKDVRKTVEDSKQGGRWEHADMKKDMTEKRALAHHAAETHNGYIFWNSLRITPGDDSTAASIRGNPVMLQAIEQRWGSYETFCDEFVLSAKSMLGNGYVWLVYEPHKELKQRADVKRYKEPEAEKEAGDDVEMLPASTEGEEASKTTAEGSAEENPDAGGGEKTAADADADAGEKKAEGAAEDKEASEPETPLDPTARMLAELIQHDAAGAPDHYNLQIVTTLKSESPLAYGMKPIFGVDTTAVLSLGNAPLTALEEQDVKDFGIKINDTENFIRRYLANVDYRRAEYQLRLCFPGILATEAGLDEAADCLRPAPGEQLHAVWMDRLPASSDLDTRLRTEVKLLSPVAELKRVCSMDVPDNYFERIREKASDVHSRRVRQRREETMSARPTYSSQSARPVKGGKKGGKGGGKGDRGQPAASRMGVRSDTGGKGGGGKGGKKGGKGGKNGDRSGAPQIEGAYSKFNQAPAPPKISHA